MNANRLQQFSQRLGGRGCVVRGGYVVCRWGSQSERCDRASAAKPVPSTPLLYAIAEQAAASDEALWGELAPGDQESAMKDALKLPAAAAGSVDNSREDGAVHRSAAR